MKVLEIKDTDQPVVKRIKAALQDGTIWIRVDIIGNRYLCSMSKKKLVDSRFYIEIVCRKKIGETKLNFTGRFFEFEILK